MPAVKTRTYRDTDEIRCAAGNMGSHFFDADTLRFFRSRIGGQTFGGRLFVTSEQQSSFRYGEHHPRLYTVRVVIPAGRGRSFDIADIGGFQAFASSGAANRAAERFARGPVEVRHDPYADVVEREGADREPNPRHYEWRVYVAGEPMGHRTTRAAARSIRADLERALRAAGTYRGAR